MRGSGWRDIKTTVVKYRIVHGRRICHLARDFSTSGTTITETIGRWGLGNLHIRPESAVMIAPAQRSTRSFLADFFPGYFGLVMATGIVSIALNSAGMYLLSNLLFAINLLSFFVLWVITILRLALYNTVFVQDLTHHARGVTFPSTVAAMCVLGTQVVVIAPFLAIADALWVLAGLLWLVLIYIFFAAITVAEKKPTLASTVDGSWLLVTVSTESLAVLGTFIARGDYLTLIFFISVCAYFLGSHVLHPLHHTYSVSLDVRVDQAGSSRTE